MSSDSHSILTKWRKQLITHEDPGHFHKILGITCLISYMWRLSMMGPADMGFQQYKSLTIPTFILHWSLTLSSFIFKIPSKRIKSGDRIWPEYRLHALVFLSRSLLLDCVYYFEQYYNLPPNYDINFLVVILTLVAADASSWSVDHRSGSIRDLDANPAVKFFFSMMQFGATSACLYGLRRFSLMFYMAFVVQINPFLMTLRRKNLLSKTTVVTLYGVMLAFAFRVGLYEFYVNEPNGFNSYWCHGIIENSATLLRLGPRIPIIRYIQDNKYLMWISLGLLLRYIRPYFDSRDPLPTNILAIIIVLRLATIALGLWKGFLRDLYNKKSHSPESVEPTTSQHINGTTTIKKDS